jgi:hypothetical protein
LYGVVATDAVAPPAGTALVSFRELAAVVGEVAEGPAASWRRAPVAPDLDAYRAVVGAIFADRTIVPAPPGVVFRTHDAVLRWLELHYVALSDALAHVDGRVLGRVHVEGRPGTGVGAVTPAHQHAEIEAVAGAVFRSLAKVASGWTAVREPEPVAGDVARASASFLVDRGRWPAFEAAVAAEATRDPAVGVWVSGPWPPYDFVRMQFGG